MKRLALLCVYSFALVTLAGRGQAITQEGQPAALRKEILAGRELIFAGNYQEAARRFADLSLEYEESPAPNFYRAVALTWQSYADAKLETGSRNFDQDMDDALVSVIKKAEAIKARPGKSKDEVIEAIYYLGSAFAMRSRLSLFQNHALPAARFARTAQNHFDELTKLAPDYQDADFAAGTIYYRVGVLTDTPIGKVAASLLGPKALPVGDRARGLKMLETAAERGPLTSVDAKLALLEIYIFNENRSDLAMALARDLQARYPNNQTFARYLLKSYLGLKDKARLAEAARHVLARVKEGRPNFGAFMKAEAEKYLAESRRL